jgi:hypothetical protein
MHVQQYSLFFILLAFTTQRHIPRGRDWIGRVSLETEGPKRDTSGKRYETMIRSQEELTESQRQAVECVCILCKDFANGSGEQQVYIERYKTLRA